jgi:hypothetical protein
VAADVSERVFSGTCLSDHFDVALGLEQHPQRTADDRVVVSKNDRENLYVRLWSLRLHYPQG